MTRDRDRIEERIFINSQDQNRLELFQNVVADLDWQEGIPADHPALASCRNQLLYLVQIIRDQTVSVEKLAKINLGFLAAREIEPLSETLALRLYAAMAEVQGMHSEILQRTLTAGGHADERRLPIISGETLNALFEKLKDDYILRGLSAELAENAVRTVRQNMSALNEEQQIQGLLRALKK